MTLRTRLAKLEAARSIREELPDVTEDELPQIAFAYFYELAGKLGKIHDLTADGYLRPGAVTALAEHDELARLFIELDLQDSVERLIAPPVCPQPDEPATSPA